MLSEHRTAAIPSLPDRYATLRGLFETLVAKSPADRPQSATAVVESLAWDRVKGDYVGLIDSLAGGSTTGSDARTGGA